MWRAFPNNENTKLWVSTRSSLKAAFSLYNPYSKNGKLFKSTINLLPTFVGNFFLKPTQSTEQTTIFEKYKKYIDNILKIDSTINISPGTNSKHQKTTVQIIVSKTTKFFLKVSDNPITIQLSGNEYNILKFINTKELTIKIPNAIYGGMVESSYFLIQTAAPIDQFKQSGTKFTYSHCIAIIDLFNVCPKTITLSEYTTKIVSSISTQLDEDNKVFEYLHKITDDNSDISIVTSLCHGDFSPWNILINDTDTLFIFDWEHGNTETPLLFDFFHFHYMTTKLLTQTSAIDTNNYLNDLFFNSEYKLIFEHMNININTFILYKSLYLIHISLREISENNHASSFSMEILKLQ